MARPRKAGDKAGTGKRRVEQYDHKGQQRKNNPPVGLVTEATDRDAPKKQYAYDPHLDPTLTWAGKAEHAAFEPIGRGDPDFVPQSLSEDPEDVPETGP